jgi:hypothetical protein
MRWHTSGLLSPEGGGRQRVVTCWQPKDVREASILGGLRRAGVTMQSLRDALAYLRRLGHNPMSSGDFLVVRGRTGKPKDVIKVCGAGEAIRVLSRRSRGQFVFPIWTPLEEPQPTTTTKQVRRGR